MIPSALPSDILIFANDHAPNHFFPAFLPPSPLPAYLLSAPLPIFLSLSPFLSVILWFSASHCLAGLPFLCIVLLSHSENTVSRQKYSAVLQSSPKANPINTPIRPSLTKFSQLITGRIKANWISTHLGAPFPSIFLHLLLCFLWTWSS